MRGIEVKYFKLARELSKILCAVGVTDISYTHIQNMEDSSLIKSWIEKKELSDDDWRKVWLTYQEYRNA